MCGRERLLSVSLCGIFGILFEVSLPIKFNMAKHRVNAIDHVCPLKIWDDKTGVLVIETFNKLFVLHKNIEFSASESVTVPDIRCYFY